ncbi:hypothetical protein WMY93_023715 [Mugilogobius chulae]|uniref:Ankyrin repeat, SAM and basic leucine zipper domain-containing protein 1 n=1 Tax=Mugilogobius chulae TaxID=88201 RepID=A0AAW0NH83_9GOBI
MGSIDFAYPAGDESEISSDEWDIGLPEKKPSIKKSDCCIMFGGLYYIFVVVVVVKMCKFSLQKEVDTAPADDKVSALKIAISKGDVETVEQLLDNGMDVDSRLDYDWTPLMCAVSVANQDLTKILLDRGASANFSKDHWTVLMACCTASAPEEKICSCLELLLSRNADPNLVDRSHMSCLMLVSRDGYSKAINLLVSHGASVNSQDLNGFTALCYAVQYGREESVLKLLQLGADKNIKTKLGKTATDLATQFKHLQIIRILASTSGQNSCANPFYSEESRDCANKLDDLELLFHGLGLGYLTDIINDHDISWSQLLTMDSNDLQEMGITEPGDQQKVLRAVQQMELDKVDLETVSELGAVNAGSEELHTFLVSVKQQCSYLTETIQDVVSRFPRRASQMVFTLDPNGETQSVCNQLLIQTKDLQQEVTLLRNLLCQMDQAEDCSHVPTLPSGLSLRWRRVLKGAALSSLGAGVLALLLLRLSKGPSTLLLGKEKLKKTHWGKRETSRRTTVKEGSTPMDGQAVDVTRTDQQPSCVFVVMAEVGRLRGKIQRVEVWSRAPARQIRSKMEETQNDKAFPRLRTRTDNPSEEPGQN